MIFLQGAKGTNVANTFMANNVAGNEATKWTMH
jgi:hypothetical protein